MDLLHEDTHRELLASLGEDEEATRGFYRGFVEAWDDRLARLTLAVHARDATEARVVLLSLSSSTTMIGARALHEMVQEIGALIAQDEAVAAAVKLFDLRELGEQTCRAIEQRHLAAPPAAPLAFEPSSSAPFPPTIDFSRNTHRS